MKKSIKWSRKKFFSLAKDFRDYDEDDFIKSIKYTQKLFYMLDFRERGIALPNGITYMSSGTIFDISHRDYFKYKMQGKNYVSEIFIIYRRSNRYKCL